eukprot:238749-Chlamydomonas_euryale.AAC.1
MKFKLPWRRAAWRANVRGARRAGRTPRRAAAEADRHIGGPGDQCQRAPGARRCHCATHTVHPPGVLAHVGTRKGVAGRRFAQEIADLLCGA